MVSYRRGQRSGAGAAVLIAVVAAFIVIYILFLPPQIRQELLEEGTTAELLSGINQTLLSESPGRLDYLTAKEIDHTLPAINLFSSTSSIPFASQQSAYVKNAWFDKQELTLKFSVDKISQTKNIQLVFNVKEAKGRLNIIVNDRVLFDEEIISPNFGPLTIPKEILKEDNTLTISVSEVGLKFWTTNEYTIQDVRVLGDVTDVSTQTSKLVFPVSSTERNNLERVFVKFVPDCQPGQAGVLEVFLNNNQIYSSVPDCGMSRPLEVTPTYVLSGQNTLVFRTQKGAYLIDGITITSKLKDFTYPIYYFNIDDDLYDIILNSEVDISLQLDFVNDIELKSADVYINGHAQSLSTRDSSFNMRLNNFITQSNNAIEIRPRTTIDVTNLRVVVE